MDVYPYMVTMDQFHKSQNAPVPYPRMLHSEQKCAHFCSEWSILGYGTGAFWDIWIRPITKRGVNKRVLCGKFLRIQGFACFRNQAYTSEQCQQCHLYVSSMFCFFVIYINTYIVRIAHFIYVASITWATWMTVLHLVNIRNEYWCESSFPLSQFDISFRALTTKIDICIFSYLDYQNSSAFVEQAILIKGDKGTICERLSDSWSAWQFSPHC